MKTKNTKLEARLDAIKKVGFKLFLERGYENTSFKDIIKITGGSYSSIYNKFSSKENFFYEILEERMVDAFNAFDRKMQDNFHLNLKDFLLAFSKEFLNLVQSTHYMQAYRLVMSASYQNPSIQKWLASKSEFAMFRTLANYFEKSDEINEKYKEENIKAAKIFCGCLKNYILVEKFILGMDDLKNEELDNYINFVVDMFLVGIYKK